MDDYIAVVSQFWFQVIMAISNVLVFYITTTMVVVAAELFSSFQFSQFVLSGFGMLLELRRWTRRLGWRSMVIYATATALVWASSHVSLVMQRVGSYGQLSKQLGPADITLDNRFLPYVIVGPCSNVIRDTTKWYNCTDIADGHNFTIDSLEPKVLPTSFDADDRTWTIRNPKDSTILTVATFPDYTKLFNKTDAIVYTDQHVRLVGERLESYIDETLENISPIFSEQNALKYMMASQGQWYLNSTDLLVNTTMKYSSIQTVPSGDNYTVYYNIEFTTTNAMANISCNDTDHGSMYRDNYYQITHAKQNMPNNPSDERYTTAIYDLQWSATSDTYEVSVLKLVDVRYHDSGPSILGYCSSLMYNAKIKLLVAELPSVDMKSTGRWDSIVDLGYGMSINAKGLFNKAITLCSIDAYNKPEARKCNWPNFKRVIGNYHQLVTQMFRDRSESPVQADIHLQGHRVESKEGYRIRKSGIGILAALAGLALLCLIPRVLLRRYKPYRNHGLDIITATTAGGVPTLRRLPDIEVTLGGNRKSGYYVIVNDHVIQAVQQLPNISAGEKAGSIYSTNALSTVSYSTMSRI